MQRVRGSEVYQLSAHSADAIVLRCIAACAEVIQQLMRNEEPEDLPLRVHDDLEHLAVCAAGPLFQSKFSITEKSAALLQTAGK